MGFAARRTLLLGTTAARVKSGVKSKLFRAALANDVLYVPGELCYADDQRVLNRTTKCESVSAAQRKRHSGRNQAAGEGVAKPDSLVAGKKGLTWSMPAALIHF